MIHITLILRKHILYINKELEIHHQKNQEIDST